MFKRANVLTITHEVKNTYKNLIDDCEISEFFKSGKIITPQPEFVQAKMSRPAFKSLLGIDSKSLKN